MAGRDHYLFHKGIIGDPDGAMSSALRRCGLSLSVHKK